MFYLNAVNVFHFLKDNMQNYYLCFTLIEETLQRVVVRVTNYITTCNNA